MTTTSESTLKRELKNRHVQLIAIGGCIGTGLFMGSGKTIAAAGPSVLFIYAVIGVMLYFLMRAMGEILLSDPRYRSFAEFAEDLLGPWAGYVTGWSYWFAWMVTAMAEIIAIAGYCNYWWPDLPTWIPALSTVVLLISINLFTVKAFGEIEFWFALIKILAILSLIALGIILVAKGFVSPEGDQALISNLWSYGGFFPKGESGLLTGFRTAVFAFVGMEVVGITAAEVKDPETVLPRAINSIPIRILGFYLGTLAVLMMVTPWLHIAPDRSPFVGMFSLTGFLAAASLVNFVVVTSAASSANSGTYTTSRMIYGLAIGGDASPWYRKLSSKGVPIHGLWMTCIMLFLAVALLAAGETVMDAFDRVTSVASLLFIFVWSMILISYFIYRARRPELHAQSKFKMPFGRIMSGVVLLFFGFLLYTLWLDPASRETLVILPAWFVILSGVYFLIIRRNPAHAERRARFKARTEEEWKQAAQFKMDQKR